MMVDVVESSRKCTGQANGNGGDEDGDWGKLRHGTRQHGELGRGAQLEGDEPGFKVKTLKAPGLHYRSRHMLPGFGQQQHKQG